MSTRYGASRSRAHRWLPVLAVFVGIAFHVEALRWWWLWDDPQLLLHALRVDTVSALFNPAEYRTLASHTFTPLLPASFKIDILIGGLRPGVAYAHQIFALVIAAVLMDQLLRRYVDRWVAAFSSLAFLASWMGVYAARTLMIRHYVEGLVLALAALILWSDRHGDGSGAAPKMSARIAGSVFFFLAILEKEIFAPLPLFMVLQKRANGMSWRVVAKELVAPAIAGVVWLAWRTFMLGSLGGYAEDLSIRDIAGLPAAFIRALSGPALPYGAWVTIALVIALTAISIIRTPSRAVAALVFPIAALVPVVTLAGNFEWRFAFAGAVCLYAGLALIVSLAFPAVRTQRLVVAGVALATLIAAPFNARAYARVTEPVVIEGRWLWENGASSAGLVGQAPSWYLGGVRDLKNLESSEGSPRFVSSLLAFSLTALDATGWVTWDPASRSLRPVAGTEIAKLHARRVPPRPMRASIRRDSDVLSWSFVSEHSAEWSIVTLPHFEKWGVPAEGERRVPISEDPGFLIIVSEWSDGSWSASSEIPFPVEGEETTWTVR